MLSLTLMLILTLRLLLILVDFKLHGNITISLDANLGARSSLFITNTTANGNCDAGISRNTSHLHKYGCLKYECYTANKIQLKP